MNLYIILFIIGLLIILGAYISVKSQFEHFANAYEYKNTEYKVSYPDKNEIKDKICSNNYFKFFKLLEGDMFSICGELPGMDITNHFTVDSVGDFVNYLDGAMR